MAFKYVVKSGDTLNKISNRFGFRNYRDAGVNPKSLQSFKSGRFGTDKSPDNISIGEEITLENYDPNKVQTSPSATPIVLDTGGVEKTFNDESDFVKSRLGVSEDKPEEDTKVVQDEIKEEPVKTDKPEPPKAVNGITDPLYVGAFEDDKEKREEAKVEMDDEKTEFMSRIDTRLARNSERLQSSLRNIEQIWDKRIKIQDRLNKLNDNRIKAYGLAGSAIYQPIQYTGATTLNESNSADKIAELSTLRERALNEAKIAFENGESIILSDKVKGIKQNEKDLEDEYLKIEQESEKQYKLFVELEKQQKAKDKALREKTLKDLVALLSLRYRDTGMTPEDENLEIQDAIKLGLTLSEAYNAIRSITAVNLKDEKLKLDIEKGGLDIEKKKLDIKDRPDVKARKEAESKALIEQRKASAEASKALAKNREDGKTDGKITPEEMSADIPDTFTSDEEAEKERKKFVKKYGTTGAKHWNSIFEINDAGVKYLKYPIGSKSSSNVLTSPDGVQEVSLSDLTKEEIEEAKKAGWK